MFCQGHVLYNAPESGERHTTLKLCKVQIIRNDPTLQNQLAKLSQSLLCESVFMYMTIAGDGCCISCPIKTKLMCSQHKKYFVTNTYSSNGMRKMYVLDLNCGLQVYKGTYPRQYHTKCKFDVKRLLNMLIWK